MTAEPQAHPSGPFNANRASARADGYGALPEIQQYIYDYAVNWCRNAPPGVAARVAIAGESIWFSVGPELYQFNNIIEANGKSKMHIIASWRHGDASEIREEYISYNFPSEIVPRFALWLYILSAQRVAIGQPCLIAAPMIKFPPGFEGADGPTLQR